MEISSESGVYMVALFLITEEASKATNVSPGKWDIEATCSSQRTPNTASTKQRPSSLSDFGDSSNRRMRSVNTASRSNKSKGYLTSLFKRACEAQRYHTVRQNVSYTKNNVKADKVLAQSALLSVNARRDVGATLLQTSEWCDVTWLFT